MDKMTGQQYNKKIYESFIYIVILTTIGGFLNGYTYVLHGEYLSTMNTGNMARIGLAISEGDLTGITPYAMSIAANALGAMTTFVCRKKVASFLKVEWQKLCLITELVIFGCIGLLPAAVAHTPVNFAISFMAGLQLASFTVWEGNLVATTIASGNVRFIGEHMGDVILDPSWENIGKFIMFLFITVSFIFGVTAGADISKVWGGRSIFVVCFLIVVLLLIEAKIRRRKVQEN